MGQIARAADRKLVARANELVPRMIPAGAKERGRSIDVFRNAPGREVFVAKAFVTGVTARGKEGADSRQGVGRDVDAPNAALRALIAALEQADGTPLPLIRPTGTAKKRPATPRVTTPPTKPRRVIPVDRAMLALARRLLGQVVPKGATSVKKQIHLEPRDDAYLARASATWRSGRTAGSLVVSAEDRKSGDPRNVALARLLPKLEKAGDRQRDVEARARRATARA